MREAGKNAILRYRSAHDHAFPRAPAPMTMRRSLASASFLAASLLATDARAFPSFFGKSPSPPPQPAAPSVPPVPPASKVQIPAQPPVPDGAPALPPVLVQSGPLTFAPLVKRVIPAVVNIAITQTRNDGGTKIPPQIKGTPLEKRYREKMRRHQEEVLGAGSGFIIDPSGIIVTNDHVVGDADNVTVSLSNGQELPAKLVGVDALTDVAVIKVESPKPLPYVAWGDSQKVDVGDWILVAGNPFGFGSSVTAGIVSARGRDLGAGSLDDFLQLDAPINPGNSGGPAFNMRGQVVAVNAAMVSPAGGSVGIGFGIPSEIVAPVVEQLRKNGHVDHGWLGVTLDDGDGSVQIVDVDKDGPAMKGGLQRQDRVNAINGAPVDNARALLRTIAAAKPNDTLSFSLTRKDKPLTLAIKIGKRPADADD
ncbi:S1C family serine protease [Kozakia baliensis]|uniref:S1C family serine protease n=2 Tax=Kozakia baliensis TaxID=153496 RepID=UPI000A7F1380|nr:trypsin-like peptidase domain-containing protein [Kozakia baliensis]